MPYQPEPVPAELSPAYVGRELRRIADELAQLRRFTLGDPRIYTRAVEGVYTFRIPSDFPTLQSAVDTLARRPPLGETITLLIESGHALTHGLQVRDGDFGHFRIEAEDAIVPLAQDFEGVDTEAGGGSADSGTDNLIAGINATMPVLACVIDMGGAHENGYVLTRRSTGLVENDCGVINAGDRGVNCRNSTIYAPLSIWNGARGSGVFLTRGAVADLQRVKLNNCCSGDASSTHNGALFVSRASMCNFMFGSAHSSGTHAIRAHRSRLNAIGANLSNAGEYGVFAIQTSNVNAQECQIHDCGVYGAFLQGSFVNLHRSNLAGGGTADVYMARGAYVVMTDASTTNGSPGAPNSAGSPSIADIVGPPGFNTPSRAGLVLA